MTNLVQNLTGQTAQPPGLNVGQTQGAGAFMGAMPAVQQWASLGGNMLPDMQQVYNQMFYNPYQTGAMDASKGASAWGEATAGNVYGTGSGLVNAGMGMIPGAYQIMNTGFDPQNALYDRTRQQVQDQVRAGEAARGIGTTPYGAGVEGTTMSNFNIDWQNNLLNRQAQAAGAAGGLLGAAGQAASTGTPFQMMAPQYYASMGALPYSTFQGMNQDQLNAIMQMMGFGGAAQGLAQAPVQDWASLYGLGNQQQGVAANIYGNQIKQQQNTFQDLMKIGSGLGSLPWGQIGSTLGNVLGGSNVG